MGVQIQGDTGNVIATKGTFSGDVGIAGTLTYEDVTNIDSVGLVTARNGIEIGARPGVAASISVDGNMIVSGISTFGGALSGTTGTFSGAISGTTGTFTSHVSLGDSDELRLGAGNDLKLYHNGTNSYIDNITGDFYIRGVDEKWLYIQAKSGENSIVCKDDGAVELYYDNDKKAETVSTGFSVGNQLSVGEAVINLEKSGTHHHRIIGNDTGGDLGFQQSADNGSNTNFTTYLRINDGGNISLPVDNQILALGASADLQIKHDGSDSYVTNAVGNLNIVNSTNGWIRLQPKSGEEGVIAKYDGAVELFHDNSKKFETTSDGATVTGSLTLTSNLIIGDGDELKLGNSSDMTIWHSGSDFTMYNSTGNLVISNASGTGAGEGQIVFKSGNNNTRWTITSGGDFIPASNNSFTVGSSSNRVAVFYSNTSLNTSDRNEKNTITDSDLGLSFINKLRPVSYKWNQKEGENLDTKTHYGLIAQDIEETVLAEGKEITDFGFIDKSKEGHMNLAYNELISPLIKAVQELSAENTALKARLDAAGL